MLVNCNGTVVNANTIALETFESPGTGLVGRGLLDLLPTFDSKLIPGSMRRADGADDQGRTKPTRMIARRTDGTEFPVEVTSANLEDGRDAYASHTERSGYTGDELLMLVVRDLSGTVDTEAELARSQRQTEMILRAASEGVVGTDTDGRVVLVNPAAAQILGYRASDLGGKELHPLAIHSKADGTPFPYEDSPLADTLKSGRKHRVRGQVLWAKNGKPVAVDLTTAPVRDGDQLVGAVMTFTDRRPYDELVEKQAEVLDRETKRYEEMAGRHAQLTAVLGDSLRGPLEELRGELGTLASDPAGQLWPEANQILHHLAAGYARMTTLVDNVLGFQRLAAGTEQLDKQKVLLDGVVAAGVEGAIELIGPGRAQFAVHAPPIEAEVDAGRLATALAHLVADVAGIDSTGKAPTAAPGGGYADSTIVVAAAQRGEVVRIEVRGPYAGGDPVHEPIVRGIVAAHGGVLQTHEVPGMGGNAYVLEVPLGAGSGAIAPPQGKASVPDPVPVPAQQSAPADGGGRRARRSSTDAFLEPDGKRDAGADGEAAAPTGYAEARGLWHSTPVDKLFPPTIKGDGAGPGGADRVWTRVAVAPDSGCAKALDPLLLKAVEPVGCLRLLRATYTDATTSSVTTVGLLFTEADAPAMNALRARFSTEGLADRTDLMPRTYPAEGTVAAGFGDRQRASWTVRVLTDVPVVVYAVSGFADGRAVADPQPAGRATVAGATNAPAQAGLGHEAKGIADRVERGLRKTAQPATEPPR
ncbi:PAS domain-containing protein [Streptomyces albidochromogenes]|uniref:PAS domain-containing protein n=1 Tax=Streptomyces albidochromogenes TaxID=329524 RepID=UPI003F6E223C